MKKGYSPVQAAAITGNIQQESGFDPNNLNQKEGAFGLLQWRGDRLTGLKNFASATGRSPSDPTAQLDYIGAEMAGPEARNAPAFNAAQDLDQANNALKGYIRYGDNSQGARLKYAQSFLGQSTQPTQVAQAQPSPAQPATTPATPQQAQPPIPQVPPGGLLGSGMAQNSLLGGLPYQTPQQQAMNMPQLGFQMRRPVDVSGLASLLQNAPPSLVGLLSKGYV